QHDGSDVVGPAAMTDEDLELVTHVLGTQVVHFGTRERRPVVAGQPAHLGTGDRRPVCAACSVHVPAPPIVTGRILSRMRRSCATRDARSRAGVGPSSVIATLRPEPYGHLLVAVVEVGA